MPWIEVTGDRPTSTFKAHLDEKRPWYQIKNAASDQAELLLFDEIGGWGTYAGEIVEELKAITASKLTVHLNSPGGEVFEGIAVANALRAHPAEVTVQVEGLAASIASVIALAGDRLVMMPHSMLMIHDASGLCYGQAGDMHQTAELLDKLSMNLAAVYSERAGGTVAEWRSRMLAETWYHAQEAVDAGLADEVGQHRDTDAEPANASWDLSAFRYAGRQHAPAPAAMAALQTPPVEPAAGPTPKPEGALMALDEGLRERLGLDADADEATILEKLDETLAELTAPVPAPEPVPVAAALPEGTVAIDEATLADLREQAAQGVAARARQLTDDRDRAIDDAVNAGKITPARREHWAKAWAADPEGVQQTLASLAPGLVPLADIGAPGGEPDTSGIDAEFDRMFSTPGKA